MSGNTHAAAEFKILQLGIDNRSKDLTIKSLEGRLDAALATNGALVAELALLRAELADARVAVRAWQGLVGQLTAISDPFVIVGRVGELGPEGD